MTLWIFTGIDKLCIWLLRFYLTFKQITWISFWYTCVLQKRYLWQLSTAWGI